LLPLYTVNKDVGYI